MMRMWSPVLMSAALVLAAAACAPSPDGTVPTPAPRASSAGPAIEVDVAEDPPTDLTLIDLTDGDGEVAGEGDTVRVSYVGRGWRTGIEVGSWASPLFEFRIGDGEVIEGFERGVIGMAAGGRRQIVVPPGFAYGSADIGRLTGDTLVFVVELVEVVADAG